MASRPDETGADAAILAELLPPNAGADVRCPLVYFYVIRGPPIELLGWGTAMDSTALQELVAQVRGTTAVLAEAEQRVASFTAELAQQPQLAQSAPPIRTAKRGSSGWVAAG
jgi:hypothetical protein